MSDIEKAFTFLHDNIPQWFRDVAEIEAKVTKMQSELSKVPVSRSPLKRKTGSIESIRDLDAILEERSASGAAQQNPFVPRKRKTPSVSSGQASGQASGPSKMRSRMMTVVQYDGEIQKSFELLVRSLGTARNSLRKGKMAAKMDAMAELAGSDDDDDDEEDDTGAVMSKMGPYRHRTGLSSMRHRMMRSGRCSNNGTKNTPVELFDSTDKALEQAQALCEKAAHQSLREGDCRKELEGIRIFFIEVLESAKNEVARFAARKKEEQAAQEESRVEAPTISPPSLEPKPNLPTAVRPTTTSGTMAITSKVVEIEVDSDDEEEDEEMPFAMPPIRLTSRV